MTNKSEVIKEAQAPLRSIRDIVADLSRPINPTRLTQRAARTTWSTMITYGPLHQAVRYADNCALGWRCEIPSVSHVGENLVTVGRIIIRCAEGEVWRESTAVKKSDVWKRFGDA